MDPQIDAAMSGLRKYMFTNVYTGSAPKREDAKAQKLLSLLYEYYFEHVDQMPEEYLNLIWIRHDSPSRVVCDYIAGMTDNYAVDLFRHLFVPEGWSQSF